MNKFSIVLFVSLFLIYGCGDGHSSKSYNDYVEDKVVTSEYFYDGNGEISFRGNSVRTVWKDKYRDGHQFRATIKYSSVVTSTTKCDFCQHQYQNHGSKKEEDDDDE